MKSILFGLALLCALPGCCDWCKKDSCDKKVKKEKSCKRNECEGGNKARKDSMKEDNGNDMKKGKMKK